MAGNKYLFDLDAARPVEDAGRLEERRRIHRKNRIIAWVFATLFLLVVATGVFFGLKTILSRVAANKTPTSSVSDVVENPDNGEDDIIDSLIGNEDEISVTPPDELETKPSEEELFEEAVRAYVRSMPLSEQVANLFIVTPEQLTGVKDVTKAGKGTQAALDKYTVGGIIYNSGNMTNAKQFGELVKGTKEMSKYPLFLAVDEELGRTSFSKAMKAPTTASPKELMSCDPSMAYVEEEKIASFLSSFGLNLNLGIVAEVNPAGDDSFMSDRCFGSDVDIVTPMVVKAIEALDEYEIYSGIKFFPGQSSASSDTTKALSSTERTLEEMKGCEFIPFVEAVNGGAKMVVVSHISAPNAFGDSLPASQSKAVMTDIIRVELELDDVIVITDMLTKTAISEYYESSDACIKSLKAGADMLLSPEDFPASYDAVLEAVNNGVIAKERIEDSLVRIFKVKFGGMTYEQVSLLASPSEEE